jgi:hypothetical protein
MQRRRRTAMYKKQYIRRRLQTHHYIIMISLVHTFIGIFSFSTASVVRSMSGLLGWVDTPCKNGGLHLPNNRTISVHPNSFCVDHSYYLDPVVRPNHRLDWYDKNQSHRWVPVDHYDTVHRKIVHRVFPYGIVIIPIYSHQILSQYVLPYHNK